MAANNLEMLTDWILVHEGGYVNHPKDPGGATNKGVIQRTYDGYRSRIGARRRSVREITMEEVVAIYKTQYWDKVAGDELPAGLDYAMYDFAINSGASRAVKFLQKMLGLDVDGVIGNETMGAIKSLDVHDIEDVIVDLCKARWAWMKRLKAYKTFGRGWTRRVMGDTVNGISHGDHGVIDRAVMLHRKNVTKAHEIELPTAPQGEAIGKALEDDKTAAAKIADGASDPDTVAKVAAGVVPGMITATTMAPEGPVQWALAGALLIVTAVVALIAYKRLT